MEVKEMIVLRKKDYFSEEPWITASFEKAYEDKRGFCGTALLIEEDEKGDPNKTGILALRAFIEGGYKTEQKYVLGLRIFSFGDMATIDIVSLSQKDYPNHRDIIEAHMNKLEWNIFISLLQSTRDKLTASYGFPMAFSGGFVDKNLRFKGESADYGSNLFGWDGNEIATSILSIVKGSSEVHPFLHDIALFMKEKKMQKDFYEKLYEFLLDITPDTNQPVTGQQISALLMMKAIDRSLEEKRDLIQMITEEMTDPEGLGKVAMILGILHRLKNKS
jgi:hypothetical protein